MDNYRPSVEIPEGHFHRSHMVLQHVNMPVSYTTNKYVYIRKNFIDPSHVEPKAVIPKVLVNPHFNKKVFVNPNFNARPVVPIPKIHVNPNVQKLNINVDIQDSTNVQKIHVNPNVLRSVPVTLNSTTESINCLEGVKQNNNLMKEANYTPFSTAQKLSPITKELTGGSKLIKRRASIRSKFKIVKSSLLENSLENKSSIKKRESIRSKYKLVKSTSQKYSQVSSVEVINKFKVDNRKDRTIVSPPKNKRYVYINRFLSISDIARKSLLRKSSNIKKLSVVNISGTLYRKSPNSLRRTSTSYNKALKTENSTNIKSKINEDIKKQQKLSRSPKVKKIISPRRLRKCNIPCPYYRKYGKCRGKDNGKCYRKHDPDQIALCTKFLQGACVDEKCLLSHNVSSEKMPICKFYLEGSCSRDSCPYLHVRISPKADICRDFLEGFCRKASECDKRHQFLCPDYEKNGNCQKQRCPYPHGKMVRKYSVFDKNKFAKKSSNCKKEAKRNDVPKENKAQIGKRISDSKCENSKSAENSKVNTNRYYDEQNIFHEESREITQGAKQNSNDYVEDNGIRSRPKLGKLPSFIAFEET